MSRRLESLKERALIEDNKQFSRLAEKTQVVCPKNGLDEVPKNRATHSYEVATSSLILASHLADEMGVDLYDIDYHFCLNNVSLLHDIGHPPFGHDGAQLIDAYVRQHGVKEGFTDNNNNLVVMKKNGIAVSDYTTASVIKYPSRLYPGQKPEYIPILQNALGMDRDHFERLGIKLKGQKTTVACQIMDEADRNSYVCADLSDFISMGSTIDSAKIKDMAKRYKLSENNLMEVDKMLNIISYGRKNKTKSFFSDLKYRFNANHRLTSKGLEFKDIELFNLREFLNKVSFEFYIRPIRRMKAHQENMVKLKLFIDYVVEHEFYPSQYYAEMISLAKTEPEKMSYIRDMVGEVSDWYVMNCYEKLELESKNKNTAHSIAG